MGLVNNQIFIYRRLKYTERICKVLFSSETQFEELGRRLEFQKSGRIRDWSVILENNPLVEKTDGSTI